MMENTKARIPAILAAVLMVIAFALVGSGTVYAESVITSGDYAYTVLDDGSAQMIGYTGMNHHVEYPPSIDGHEVTRVGWEDTHYELCPDTVTSISLPDTVVSIGNYAFGGAESLQSITFGAGLKTIEAEAFNGCSGLKSMEIPSGVTSIGDSAFGDCSGMTTATIPSSVTDIGHYAFIRCSALESVELNAAIKQTGMATFDSCSSLTRIEIPSGVTIIDSGTFGNCTSLTSVTIPSSVTEIGWEAFVNCTSLASITIPGSGVHIESWAFGNCTSLKSYTINNAFNIANKAIGFFENSSGDTEKVPGVTIYGNPGGYAGSYAETFGLKFVDLTAKKENTIKVSAAAKSVKASKLKKANQTVRPLTIKDPAGTVTVTKKKSGTTSSIYKKITVNKKTGAITLKKGKYAKKTYKVKLIIRASGNSRYEAKTITKTVKIQIK